MIAAMSTPVGAQKHYKELVYPSINDIRAPDPTRVTLKNGIILYLVEDHRLPLISLRARIGVGGINESADKVGLSGILFPFKETFLSSNDCSRGNIG